VQWVTHDDAAKNFDCLVQFMSDVALSIALGIGLAAATGFRVFLPMLIVSAGAYTGHVPLGDSFAWLGTPSALTMLSVAAIVEILAYCIPGLARIIHQT
jgi:hypothetical protein